MSASIHPVSTATEAFSMASLAKHAIRQDELQQHMHAIKHHALFPLLNLLRTQCDETTNELNHSNEDLPVNMTVQEAAAQLALYQTINQNPGTELDKFMCDAVYVLRVHLAELREVCQLTDVFCERYKETIRTRLHEQHELLFGQSGDSDDDLGPPEAGYTIHHVNGQLQIPLNLITHDIQQTNTAVVIPTEPINDYLSPVQVPVSQPSPSSSESSSDQTASQNGTAKTTDYNFHGTRRSGLPKAATEILRTWLFRHASNPYPNDSEKDELVEATNLSAAQINNWFINARRRILQPVLSSSGLCERTDSADSNQNNQLDDTNQNENATTNQLNSSLDNNAT